MKKLVSHTVPDKVEKVRLSDYLPGKIDEIPSKKGIKKAIVKGHVKINGRIGKTADFLTGGEHIEIFEDKPKGDSQNVRLTLEIIYEDEYLAIINKPAGIIVSGNMKRTIENALANNLEQSSLPDRLLDPQPVHRLDAQTSGALLIGKTRSSVTALNKLFEERKIEKVYHAITIKKIDEKGEINTPIKGKNAETNFAALAAKESDKYGALNLLEIKPTTGRKHQLRIHLSSIGNPILGDKEYGIKNLISRGNGLYLHASSLKFDHPFEDKKVNIEIPLPSKFTKIFQID